jgi:hypothetical protein
MEIIGYLNHNSGLISAIATIILVGITGWYVILTKKILKSNEQSSIEMNRPFIVAHLKSEDHRKIIVF